MSRPKRRRTQRRTSYESLEARQVMSADPLGGMLGGGVQHHGILDEPAMVPHSVVEEPLQVHGSSDPDFWIDPLIEVPIESHVDQVEQLLDSAHNLTGLYDVRADYGFDGGGQTVAIIDSGIAYDHFALGGGFGSNYRVVGGWDFTEENDADPYDDGPEGSHGTHVAGIVGSTGTDGNHVGVAPDVDLVGLRVFNDAGAGYFSWVESALQWVHTNRDSFENPITAVNLSLGTEWNSSSIPQWANLEDEFAQLKADGIFIAVSAGNSFTTYDTPGLSYPAASEHVVPVMSVDDSGSLSYFSQRHTRAIAAPGRYIRSTVPDYTGNHNNVTDDWASMSGTSMASPYVAGASVLIREAMEFVGQTSITQDTIYDHMMATADSFFDSATSQTYQRLNLSAAIDALMPTDDFGSSVVDAYSLGTLGEGTQLSGHIATLDDADYFSFTAASNGTVTFTAEATHDMVAAWDANSTGGIVTGGGTQFTLNVSAGQSYTIGLNSSDGIGYYDLDVDFESSFSFVDWGSINGQGSYNNLSNSGEQWYHVVAGQAGYLTAEANFASGSVTLSYFNDQLQWLADGSATSGGQRVDVLASAGQELFLRVTGDSAAIDYDLTNLVNLAGQELSVSGTSGDDDVTFVGGSSYNLAVNGVTYSFAAAAIDTVTIDAGAGNDSIDITGTSTNETVIVSRELVQLNGGEFNLTASGFDSVLVNGGGGNDTAAMYDTAGDEQLAAWSDRSLLLGSGFSHDVRGFGSVTVYASDGNDEATFHDTEGDDDFTTWHDRALMLGDGYYNDARGFDRTLAYASGGFDEAYFRDTDGDDVYTTWHNRAVMTGTGYWHDARGFDSTRGMATSGNDVAYLRDSSGNDIFTTWSDRALMIGDTFQNDARGFDQTLAFASDGFDEAYFRDTDGDDIYTTWHNRAIMTGDGYWHDARGFDITTGVATVGNDLAYMRDSAGDDVFTTWQGRALMIGDNFQNDARGFDTVLGFSSGGNDYAFMRDSASDDVFTTWPDRAIMSGGGYWTDARGFARTTAVTSTGYDRAILRDSDQSDTVTGSGAVISIQHNGSRHETVGFDAVDLYDEHDDSDTVNVGAVDAVFRNLTLY